MLVYVVNILTMFVGPDSWGDVTEAGLEEAIFVYLLKKRKTFTVLLWYICYMLYVIDTLGVISDLLLNRCTATWNLLVKQMNNFFTTLM